MFEFLFSHVRRVIIVNFELGSDDEGASEDEQTESLLLSWDFRHNGPAPAAQHLNLAGLLRALQHFVATFGHAEDVEHLITQGVKYCFAKLERDTWMIWGVDRHFADKDVRVDELSLKRAMEQAYACFVMFHGRISRLLDEQAVGAVRVLNEKRKALRKLRKILAKTDFDVQSDSPRRLSLDSIEALEAEEADLRQQISEAAATSPAAELRRTLRSFFAHLFTPAALRWEFNRSGTGASMMNLAARDDEKQRNGQQMPVAPFPPDSLEYPPSRVSPFHAFVDCSLKAPFYADSLCMLAASRAQHELLEEFQECGMRHCAVLYDGHVLVSNVPDPLFQVLFKYISGRDLVRKAAVSSAVKAGLVGTSKSAASTGTQETSRQEEGSSATSGPTAQGFYTKDGGVVTLGDRVTDDQGEAHHETYMARPEVKIPAAGIGDGSVDVFFGESIPSSNIYVPLCHISALGGREATDETANERANERVNETANENHKDNEHGTLGGRECSRFLFYQYHRLFFIFDISQEQFGRCQVDGLGLVEEHTDELDHAPANFLCKLLQDYLVAHLPMLWKTIQTRADVLKASTMAQKSLRKRGRQRLARAGELFVPRSLPAWLKQRSKILHIDLLAGELKTHGFQGISAEVEESLPSIASTLNWPFPVAYALELDADVVVAVDDIHEALVEARGGEDMLLTDLEAAWVAGRLDGERQVIIILDKQAPMGRLQSQDEAMQAVEALLKSFR